MFRVDSTVMHMVLRMFLEHKFEFIQTWIPELETEKSNRNSKSNFNPIPIGSCSYCFSFDSYTNNAVVDGYNGDLDQPN
jgi:hypothetical protein